MRYLIHHTDQNFELLGPLSLLIVGVVVRLVHWSTLQVLVSTNWLRRISAMESGMSLASR